jgi:N6-L-threonylcarbamoyladenine synthase
MSVILGIESSCDETGIAIVRDGREVLANEIASQIDIHKAFGGVVPEIASRQHTKVISQLVKQVIDEAKVPIDAIAATQGPGLMGSLLVGLSFAKALAYSWKLPFIPVHHIEGHLFSAFLGERAPEFPFLALVVSGGHTQIIQCDRPHHYRILGTTRDDAVGESFDKVARLLDLPYPGGPSIQKAAAEGDPKAYDFPRAMRNKAGLEFSYSGLKTAVLYAMQETPNANVADMAASFQAAAIDILLIKIKQAIQQTDAQRLIVVGGVAANKLLRDRVTAELGIDVFMPPFKYCIDNGAMIAAAGDSLYKHGKFGDFTMTPNPSLAL